MSDQISEASINTGYKERRKPRGVLYRPVSRRAVVQMIETAVVMTMTDPQLIIPKPDHQLPPPVQKPSTPPEVKKTPETKKVVEATVKKEVRGYPEIHNQILSLDPLSESRNKLEADLLEKVGSFEEIQMAYRVIVNKNYRETLKQRSQKLRETNSDPDNLPPVLTEAQKQWAKNWDIDQETLSWCVQAYEAALATIQALQQQKKLRPDLPTDIDPATITMSPGGLAMILKTETNGFSYIGSKPAIDELNKEKFPGAEKSLIQLCQILSEDSGLKYDPKKVPGSSWGDESKKLWQERKNKSQKESEALPDWVNISGSALGGVQMMSWRALEITKEVREYGFKLNIFDPYSALIGIYLDCAARWKIQRGKATGLLASYELGVTQSIDNLTFRWNQHPEQMRQIKSATMDYDRKFTIPKIRKGVLGAI